MCTERLDGQFRDVLGHGKYLDVSGVTESLFEGISGIEKLAVIARRVLRTLAIVAAVLKRGACSLVLTRIGNARVRRGNVTKLTFPPVDAFATEPTLFTGCADSTIKAGVRFAGRRDFTVGSYISIGTFTGVHQFADDVAGAAIQARIRVTGVLQLGFAIDAAE